MPYLAKDCRPHFNNSLTGNSNSGPILPPPQRLFKSDSNNGPFPTPFQSCVRWSCYICSGLLLMVSWWVPYLAKGCGPDFNNGLRGDLNSGPILAPRRLFKSDSNNGPSTGHFNLVPDGVISVLVSYLWFPGRCRIWPRAAA